MLFFSFEGKVSPLMALNGMDTHLNTHSLGHTLVRTYMYIYTQTHTQKGQLGREEGDEQEWEGETQKVVECNQNIHMYENVIINPLNIINIC